MSQIEVKNVFYSYSLGEEGNVKALRNVSLSIEKGQFVTICGMNGSGKSTLAKLLNGLFLPSAGTVKIDGLLTSDEKNTFDVRKRAGMVFQNPDNQMVATIIEDDVAFGPENLGVPQAEIVERVNWALETVGMTEYKDKTASKLSGGQKQRIAIAGTLALKPEILIFDEATSMLDPKGRQEVIALMESLNKQGITIINITHNMEEALPSDRIIVLKKGEVVLDGDPEMVFSSDVLGDVGMVLPAIVDLQSGLIAEGFEFDKFALSDQELVEGLCKQLI